MSVDLNREDLIEYAKLEKVVDVENIPYAKLMQICINFAYSHLLTEDNLQKLDVNYEDAKKMRAFTDKAKAFFFDNSVGSAELYRVRIAAWEAHKKASNATRGLFRYIVCYLYEYDPADEASRQDPVLFLFFNTLLDIGVGGYCTKFGLFILRELSQQSFIE